MKITYLGHSGFLVEVAEHYLLFDYYTGKLPAFSPEKNLTVFVSHSHQDHYNEAIFDIGFGHFPITYVLSKDIRRKRADELAKKEDELLFVKAHEIYELYGGRMRIETLRSTDAGVAYIVEVAGESGKMRRIYHAGDLNLWKWAGESKAHNNNMEANYRREMELLKGKHFDAAFVPLDPRLEQFAFGGMDIFLETASAEALFPMHFWKQPEIIGAYLRERPEAVNLIKLGKEGKTYTFQDEEERGGP